MKTLYLIDGYAQFFRAYHAIRTPMTSPVTKEPTSATFGFVGMLLKLLRGEQPGQQSLGGPPDYLAVALDVSGDRGTFRSQLYPEYKANRSDIPDDLPPQIERCIALLHEIGVPTVGVEEYEADDVIASIADDHVNAGEDLRVVIISKDKDLKQLLSPAGDDHGRVVMYDVHTDQLTTAATLQEETGITPEQVVDMLTLMGDTVDNVPGVEGVGTKTAAKLIAEHGSLEALMAAADTIKGKRGEKLRAAADQIPLSKELVTLKRDVDTDFTLDNAKTESLKLIKLLPILQELGFNRYQDDVKAMLGVADEPATKAPAKRARDDFGGGLFDQTDDSEPEVSGDYHCVRTKKDLQALVKKLKAADAIAFDTETTSLQPMQAKLCGLSFAVTPEEAWYVPTRSPEQDHHLDEATVLEALKPILEDPKKPKLGHNLKYDLLVLRNAGVDVKGVATPGALDGMVASYLIDASRSSHSMDALSLALLNRSNIPIGDLIGKGKNQRTFDTVPLDRATPYAAEDADVSLQLCQRMAPEIERMGLTALLNDLEMPLIKVLAELEWNGVLVDPDELDRQRERLAGRIDELKAEIADSLMETIGREIDPDSPKQLSGALFNAPDAADPGLGIKPLKKTKTGYSTDAETLTKLADDAGIESSIPTLILEYRQLTKLVGTYLVALKEAIDPDTKRIHASFNQTVAATGRLSSSDPNLQNIPIRTEIGREIRRAFIAPEGRTLITADYSQIELRLLAHLSRDPALIEAFQRGDDIHAAVAAEIHGCALDDVNRDQRSGAKMVNFGIVYGITPFGLARRLGVSNTEATDIIDNYKKRFAGITTFLAECVEYARTHGYVETMMKRRRPIPDIDSNQPARRGLAERVAINSVVQGSAADLIKIAMVDLYKRLSPWASDLRSGAQPEIDDVLMLIQIHDELVFEAPKETANRARDLIVERMQSAMQLDVPLIVDSAIATNWYEGK
ncbi:MAG: DNA polymerase I [Planctomycetota bacterium]